MRFSIFARTVAVKHDRRPVAVSERLDLTVVGAQPGVDAVDRGQRRVDREKASVSRRQRPERSRRRRGRLSTGDRRAVIGEHLAREPVGVDDRDVQQLGVWARLRIKAGPFDQRSEPVGGQRRRLGARGGLSVELANADADTHHPARIIGVARPPQHRGRRDKAVGGELRLSLLSPGEAPSLRLLRTTVEWALRRRLNRDRPVRARGRIAVGAAQQGHPRRRRGRAPADLMHESGRVTR